MARTKEQVDTVLEGFQAKAEAQMNVNELAANIKAHLRGDVLTPETAGGLKAIGMGAEKIESTNGADIIVTLFHAYDGREIRLPLYQVEHRIGQRFPRGDRDIPQEYWGGQVWFIRSTGVTPEAGDFLCKLSINGTDEQKDEMRAAGLRADCRKVVKSGGFATEFEADEHFRKKHPRRWQAWQRYITVREQRRTAEMMSQAVAGMAAAAAPKTTTEE